MSDIMEWEHEGKKMRTDMDLCNEEAISALRYLWRQEDVVPLYDYTTAVHSLFCHCVDILTHSGWTEKELMEEILYHSADGNGQTKN